MQEIQVREVPVRLAGHDVDILEPNKPSLDPVDPRFAPGHLVDESRHEGLADVGRPVLVLVQGSALAVGNEEDPAGWDIDRRGQERHVMGAEDENTRSVRRFRSVSIRRPKLDSGIWLKKDEAKMKSYFWLFGKSAGSGTETTPLTP